MLECNILSSFDSSILQRPNNLDIISRKNGRNGLCIDALGLCVNMLISTPRLCKCRNNLFNIRVLSLRIKYSNASSRNLVGCLARGDDIISLYWVEHTTLFIWSVVEKPFGLRDSPHCAPTFLFLTLLFARSDAFLRNGLNAA